MQFCKCIFNYLRDIKINRLRRLIWVPNADRFRGDPRGVSRGVLVCDPNNRNGEIGGLGTE
jgi:hypothetical protein